MQRFEQEARATSALNHPNILTVYDIGTHEGSPYIVAELLEGEELRDRLDAGTIPLRDYAQQIGSGLSAAHEKGIVHRQNLFTSKALFQYVQTLSRDLLVDIQGRERKARMKDEG